jgi:transcription initiation factor TFIIB
MQASEAGGLSEGGQAWRCPECGASLCYDAETGEKICSKCGLVVEVERFEEPPQPKNRKTPIGPPATGRPLYSDLGKLDSERRRVYSKIGIYEGEGKEYRDLVEQYADKIGAPGKVRATALHLTGKIAKGLREAGMRLRRVDVARVALWEACKACGFWITLEEFERACGLRDRGEKHGIYSLLSKVSEAVEVNAVAPKPSYYIPRLAGRLTPLARNVQYISALEEYAARICAEAERRKLTNGKDPICVAGTALHIVDERLGGRVGRAKMAAAGIKYSQEVAGALAALKVPIPDSAFKFLWYLFAEARRSEGANRHD